jgi:hypothetical protein
MHRFKYFYDSEFMKVPEFCFENKIEVFKQKDIEILVEHLKNEEEEALKKKKAAEDALAAQSLGAPSKGKDVKKDAKAPAKAPAKGAAIADDKNCP